MMQLRVILAFILMCAITMAIGATWKACFVVELPRNSIPELYP